MIVGVLFLAEGISAQFTNAAPRPQKTQYRERSLWQTSASTMLVAPAAGSPAPAAGRRAPGTPSRTKDIQKPYVDGEVIVKYRDGRIDLQTPSGAGAAAQLSATRHLKARERFQKENMEVLDIADGKTLESKIAEPKNDPNVEYAQPNYQYYPESLGSNDPYGGVQWGLENTGQAIPDVWDGSGTISGTPGADIKAPAAWAIAEATTSASVIVAVIDSGVSYNHPDLVANMWDGSNCKDDTGAPIAGGCLHGYDYADNDNNPLPSATDSNYLEHGTLVAGIIAAAKNNGTGVAGVAPHASLMAIRTTGTTASLVRGIHFAQQNGAKVINASVGLYGTTSSIYYDTALYNAVAGFPGLFVSSAGNGSFNHDDGTAAHTLYPAAFEVASALGPGLPNIITVAATDQHDNLAPFSDYGPSSVDVGAPGMNIFSTTIGTTTMVEHFDTVTPPALPTGWTMGGTNANWGTGDGGLWTDLAVPYAANAFTYVVTPSIDLGGTDAARLSFYTWCDTPIATSTWLDYAGLQFNGGASYKNVPLGASPATSTDAGLWDTSTLDYLSGHSPGPTGYSFTNLPLPGPLTTSAHLAFTWNTDGSDNLHYGCFIDDVAVTKYAHLDGSDGLYYYESGTSFSAPYVAGLAALVEGYNPSLTAAQVKSAILANGDSVAGLSGKTVTGKRINALKTLQAINPSKAITSFYFASTTPAATSTITGTAIAVGVPYGTDVTALVPTIAMTGASVSPASGVAQNFTNPISYIVTAADGTTQTYVATVTVLPLSDAGSVALDKATLASSTFKGANADLSHIISALAALPISGAHGTTISWSSDSSTVSGDGQTVLRPIYGAPNATVHLTATITKGSATDTLVWVLTVLAALNPAKEISNFTFTSPAAAGIISGTNIAVMVPYGTAITALAPTIAITGATVSPASGSAQNFTSPVQYTVTAADGTTQSYTVTVTVADGSAKDITSFTLASPGTMGAISGTNIMVPVPYGTTVTALAPTLAVTGASVSPASGAPQDFTNPVSYTVTAQDSSTKIYTVTVVVTPPADFTALSAALASARSKYAAAVEGTLPGQYPSPLKANLQTAITTATSTPVSAAQSEVDAAATVLNAAIVVFDAGRVPPSSLVIPSLTNPSTLFQYPIIAQ